MQEVVDRAALMMMSIFVSARTNKRHHHQRSAINHFLHQLLMDIGEWRHENWRVEFTLDCLQDEAAFTREERRQFKAEIALYLRADAGRLLLARIARPLRADQMSACERELIARVAAFAKEMQAWFGKKM
jgi:hypothetical protein